MLRVIPEKGRVVVERINMIKKHQRPTQKIRQGGIIEREGSIHLSNVMLIDPGSDKPTRVGMRALADGKKVRVASGRARCSTRREDVMAEPKKADKARARRRGGAAPRRGRPAARPKGGKGAPAAEPAGAGQARERQREQSRRACASASGPRWCPR